MDEQHRARVRVFQVIQVCLAVAVVSLVLNITLPWETAGHLEVYSFARKSLSKVANSGTVWAGVSVVAGWLVARPVTAAVVGVVAAEVTLLVHYLLGIALHVYDGSVLPGNLSWFVSALIVCGPLGLCGWLASRPGRLGLLMRLVVPAGAVVEPFVMRRFSPIPQLPWPERYSDTVSSVLLVALGVAAAVLVLRRGPDGLVNPASR